jgi:hypothetical protein
VRNASRGIAIAAALLAAGAARADVVEVPAWTPEPPPVGAGPPIAPPVANRFSPTDVAAAPPPGGVLAPAPPAFDRFACDTFTCGGRSRGLHVIESPVKPGDLPGDLPGPGPGALPGLD